MLPAMNMRLSTGGTSYSIIVEKKIIEEEAYYRCGIILRDMALAWV